MNLTHFTGLNYTLANEDTTLEYAVLPESARHVVSIAGSGSRVLPLLARCPAQLTVVDLSQEQLYLTQLRLESLRELSYDKFLEFWGYLPGVRTADGCPGDGKRRKELFLKISPSLSRDAYDDLKFRFESMGWESLLYTGKWEKEVIQRSSIVRRVLGASALRLFECRNLEEQRLFLKKEFPHLRWKTLIFLMSQGARLAMALRPDHYPNKNIHISHYQFYHGLFERLFQNAIARENFFLQLSILGRIVFPEGCPIECDPVVFQKAKNGVQKARIQYVKGDALSIIRELSDPADFVSFSNAPSYFRGQKFIDFLQEIAPGLQKGARIVVRYFLNIPDSLNLAGYKILTEEFQKSIEEEKLQFYDIQVYHRILE